MTNINDIPDELLLEMCEGWDDRTILNMSQAYSRVYQVCSKIIDLRKTERLERKQLQGKIENFKFMHGYSIIELRETVFGIKYHKIVGPDTIVVTTAMAPWEIYLPSVKVLGGEYAVKRFLQENYFTNSEIEILFQEVVTPENYRDKGY